MCLHVFANFLLHFSNLFFILTFRKFPRKFAYRSQKVPLAARGKYADSDTRGKFLRNVGVFSRNT